MNNTKFLSYITAIKKLLSFRSKSKSEKIKNDSDNVQMNKVYIGPNYNDETTEYIHTEKTGQEYSIFILNQTANAIIANEKVTIKPDDSFVFMINDDIGVSLNNGIQFFFGDTEGLEVIDNNIQVVGLDAEWLAKLNVPESADLAFSIVDVGQGDPISE